jgi:hypothetical protein
LWGSDSFRPKKRTQDDINDFETSRVRVIFIALYLGLLILWHYLCQQSPPCARARTRVGLISFRVGCILHRSVEQICRGLLLLLFSTRQAISIRLSIGMGCECAGQWNGGGGRDATDTKHASIHCPHFFFHIYRVS